MACVKSSMASFQFPVRNKSIPREQYSSAVEGGCGACVLAGIASESKPPRRPVGSPAKQLLRESFGAAGHPNHRHVQLSRQFIQLYDFLGFEPDKLLLAFPE